MKLTKTSLAIAALFFCLGSASVFAASATNPVPTEVAIDPSVPEVVDNAALTEDTVADDATTKEMNTAELEAEIRIACEEFAVDEKVAEEKVPDFVDACIAENAPAEETDAIEAVDNGVPAVEEAATEDGAAPLPVVTGQANIQE